MSDRLTEIDNLPDIGKINIENRDLIQFVQIQIIDNRFDNVLFAHYGINYTSNYGVSRNLLIYLVLTFNDLSDISNLTGNIKLPNIYQLIENLILVNDNNFVNGVYTNIKTNLQNNNQDNNNSIINELKLRLNAVTYDKTSGIIKF